MIAPVASAALPLPPDAPAPTVGRGFAEILAIQSPIGTALPTLPSMPSAGVTDPATTPVDFPNGEAMIVPPSIAPIATALTVPPTPAQIDGEVVPPLPDGAMIPTGDRPPIKDHRSSADTSDDDPAAPVPDITTVPTIAWLVPQPPIYPEATHPERGNVSAAIAGSSVAAPAPAEPGIARDAAAPEPKAARVKLPIPDARRVATVVAPRQSEGPSGSPIDVPVDQANTYLAPVVTQTTAATLGPTSLPAAPDRASAAAALPTSPTSAAQTSPAKVEQIAPDTRVAAVPTLPLARIAVAPEDPLPARPTQSQADDLGRRPEALLAVVSAALPAFLPPDAPPSARPVSTAQPSARDPLSDPTFAIATPALGEISAAVTASHDSTGERLHVHFAVERDATAALIAGHDGLDRALAAAGARLDTVSVEVRSSTERSSSDAPRPDARAPDPDRPRRPPPRSPQLRVAAPGRDRFA